jgi:hypothetical protein
VRRSELAVALETAAFHDSPATALPLLRRAEPLDERARWLAGVCLGALGRYGQAREVLLPGGSPASSLAASAAGSHLRQLGRHAEAEPLDRLALAAADDAEARSDALVGLVADAVGRLDLDEARLRLATATRAVADPPTGGVADRAATAWLTDGADAGWRAQVRLRWVLAEVALLGDDPAAARGAATEALALSRRAGAPRHSAKSLLVLGAATEAGGDPAAALTLLRQAAAMGAALGVPPLVWPSRLLIARLLGCADSNAAARERRAAMLAIRVINCSLPAAEPLLCLPDPRCVRGSRRPTVSDRASHEITRTDYSQHRTVSITGVRDDE